MNGLQSAHFFDDRNRRIFRSMQVMDAVGEDIDEITLLDNLGKDAGSAGGPAYIASLTDGRQSLTNVAHYATIIQEKAILRNLMRFGENIQQQVADGDDVTTIVERARKINPRH